jgi:hypothetical protein
MSGIHPQSDWRGRFQTLFDIRRKGWNLEAIILNR